MTTKEALADSIAHWQRMIAWAALQKGNASRLEMSGDINECWGAAHCALCNEINNNPEFICPLGDCRKTLQCNILWVNVSDSYTWEGWTLNAKLMLEYMQEIYDKMP